MRLLISEFICGGGMANHALPESLKQEGLMMLQALLADCLQLENCEIVTTLDSRIQLQDAGAEIISVADSKNYMRQLLSSAENFDWTWIVAPESEGVLASTVNSLQKSGCPTLNCSVDAIQNTGDKYKCTELMQSAGIAVIPHIAYTDLIDYPGDVVVKPRFGAGSENLSIYKSGVQAKEQIDTPENWIIQPFVEGEHRSLSLLCWRGAAKILSCNVQMLSDFPQPRLRKCVVNAFAADSGLHTLAMQIAQVFPGLNGYVGVDYIKTASENVVVEINPRLTTSYLGLARALVQNPAQLCIETFAGGSLPNFIENTENSTEVILV